MGHFNDGHGASPEDMREVCNKLPLGKRKAGMAPAFLIT